MNRLLNLFESIIILRTNMDNIDLNFICIDDLEKIIDVATELDIDLNCLEYDKIEYNTQQEQLTEVYYDWYEDINTMYLNVKNSLLRLI